MDTKSGNRAAIGADYQAVVDELATLRADLLRLTSHLAEGAAGASATAKNTLSAEAQHLSDVAAAAGKSTATSIEAQIDAHPLVSLVVAFALGLVGSRLLAR